MGIIVSKRPLERAIVRECTEQAAWEEALAIVDSDGNLRLGHTLLEVARMYRAFPVSRQDLVVCFDDEGRMRQRLPNVVSMLGVLVGPVVVLAGSGETFRPLDEATARDVAALLDVVAVERVEQSIEEIVRRDISKRCAALDARAVQA